MLGTHLSLLLAVFSASRALAFMRVPGGSIQIDDAKDSETVEQLSIDSSMRRQELRNVHDLAYTGTIKVGGQSIEAIFDSGSFELVIFSNLCAYCGKRAHLFNANKSKKYNAEGDASSVTYGSGTAYVVASHDDVAVAGLVSPEEFFWTVYDVDKTLGELLREGTFGGIMGVGPSSSVKAFAAYELKSLQTEVDSYMARGGRMTETIQKVLHQYEYNLATAKSSTTVLDKLGVREMSICLGRDSGSPGYFTWNDNATRATPASFVNVPVVGEFYWSAQLGDIRLGAVASDVAQEWALPQTMVAPTYLGCDKHACSAILDTGTSLMSAPSEVLYTVQDILSVWEKKGGGCDDLSLLPDLEFTLGGKPFRLPPESYVARFSGSDAHMEKIKDLLPHLYKAHKNRKRKSKSKHHTKEDEDLYTYCSSLLSPTNADTQYGPLWIMGMSFFRQYYTTFQLTAKGDKLHGSKMSFAIADDHCRPQHPNDQLLETAPTISATRPKREAQLHLNVSMVRPSSVLSRLGNMGTKIGISERSAFRQVADDEEFVPFLRI